MRSEGQSSLCQLPSNRHAVLFQTPGLLGLHDCLIILEQDPEGFLAFEQVTFVLLVCKLAGSPPPHQPERLHFVVHKRPIVSKGPQGANLGAVHIKVRPVSRDSHIGAPRFVQLLRSRVLREQRNKQTDKQTKKQMTDKQTAASLPTTRTQIRSHARPKLSFYVWTHAVEHEVRQACAVNPARKGELGVQMHSTLLACCVTRLFQGQGRVL